MNTTSQSTNLHHHLNKPFNLFKTYIAKHYAKLYSPEMFIGVTGAIGKSSTIEACKAVLSQKYKTITTSTSNSLLNVPDTILKLKPSVKKIILEMGLEFKGDVQAYLSLINPQTMVFTRVYPAYSEHLGDIEAILKEYRVFLEQASKESMLILNWDDIYSKKLAEDFRGTVVYYGSDPKNCTVWVSNIKIDNFCTTFELNLGVERVKVNYKPLGVHQVYAALAAAALGVIHNIPLIKIKLALEKVEPFEHKLQALLGPNGSIILDDTGESSIASIDAAIDTILQIPARRRVVVLGEMKKSGVYSDMLHRQVARRIYKEKIDLVFLGQGGAQIITDELKNLGYWDERVEADLQNSQLVSKLLKTLNKGDICLIKAEKSVRLDEVVKRISKKT